MGKEETRWTASWWDYYSLAEHSQRPIEWSNSSVVFSAHPTQPVILARHFSSSKQFSLPPPTLVITSLASYQPPTIISASPDDEWLFAYYPGNTNDGVSCIWKRGVSIDAWSVQEYWNVAPSAGIVAAAWLGSRREWTSVQSGASVRLDPRGPKTPVSNPTLALVTQNLQFTVCYFRFYIPNLKMISVSLLRNEVTDEAKPNLFYDSIIDGDTVKVCVNAAIGLGYNESSILVATRSHIYPTPPVALNSQFNPIDLTLDMNQPQFDPEQLASDLSGEERTIELCEIKLDFDVVNMRLSSFPLAPVHHPSPKLTNLTFIATPPPPKSPDENQSRSGSLYLAASFLDFGDYSTLPKSDIILCSMSRHTEDNTTQWKSHREATRQFSEKILTFIVPRKPSYESGLFVGLLNSSGNLPRHNSKSRHILIGSTHLLKIPNLTDLEDWEPSSMFSTKEKAGREVPLNAALSPNEALICTASSSLWMGQTCIHPLPERKSAVGQSSHPPLAVALAKAVTLRKTTADLTSALSLPSTKLNDAIDILDHTFAILESQENGISNILTWEAIGLTMEMYKRRASRMEKGDEQEELNTRWHAAHDMCSLAALNAAFSVCKDGETYDLNAIWQLVGTSSWTVGFVEKLLKECVLSYNLKKQPLVKDETEELFGFDPSSPTQENEMLTSPLLLHMVHPIPLTCLKAAVGHVHAFRNYIKPLHVKNENEQIARDVLIDLVDCSGIDLGAFESLLGRFIDEIKLIQANDLRRCLASCQPTAALQPYLRNILQIMSESNFIDKARLFIKPHELIDGIGRLDLETPKKDKDKDVVSKALLTKRGTALSCLRCGGQTEIKAGTSSGHASMHWFGWEKTWVKRCICGGYWIGQPI